MAFTTASLTSFADFITQANTWMATVGWTSEHIDITTTATTGGEWAMRRTSGATNIRFAASWDAENAGTLLALYHYSDQNYVIGDRPWGQDHDSGNGFAGSTPDSSIEDQRHVIIGTTPIRWWGFESDDYTHLVVKTVAGEYQHFGFGMLEKFGGDWTGGEYVYGQINNRTGISSGIIALDGVSFLLDGMFNDTSDANGPDGSTTFGNLMCATIHCEGMPNQTAGGYFGVVMGGTDASPQTVFGNDRQSNDGASSDTARELFTWGCRGGPFANGYYRMDGTDVSGHTAIWPVAVTYVDTTTGDIHGYPIGRMKDVGMLNIKNYEAEQEITLAGGAETWTIFPANKKYPGSGTNSSGYLGIAYKQVA